MFITLNEYKCSVVSVTTELCMSKAVTLPWDQFDQLIFGGGQKVVLIDSHSGKEMVRGLFCQTLS